MRAIERPIGQCLRNKLNPASPFPRLRYATRWHSNGRSEGGRQWSTPLAKNLAEAISTTGPIPVAAYMRQCLTSPDGGYYTSRNKDGDQFGQKGDFITSPEISQMFGELIGLWIVAEWKSQGIQGRGLNLIEVGPGRGTLMDDVLRWTLKNFPTIADSVEKIYLVEASKSLREAQHRLLCEGTLLEGHELGYSSHSKYSKRTEIVWCEDIKFVPKDPAVAPFIVAHELFDALPIHVFQAIAISESKSAITTSATPSGSTGHGTLNEWREMLVNPTSDYDATMHSRSKKPGQPPDFELMISPSPTPHSQLLPRISQRYQQLLSQTGSIIEISPESLALISDFAMRVGGTASSRNPSPAGAALIMDYGPSATIPTNSLRGIQSHQNVSPFSSAGQVDISADVDFLGLAHAALDASPGVEVHGPIEQALFLSAMGIKERADMLLNKAGGNEEVSKRIEASWKRLVDRGPNGMGKTYKAMAILPHYPNKEMRRPVGFGGDLPG